MKRLFLAITIFILSVSICYARYVTETSIAALTVPSGVATASTVTQIPQKGFAYQAVWGAGSSSGSILLQASADSSTWNTVSGTSTAITAAGNVLWNVSNAYYKYVRAYVMSTNGTLTAISLTINSKLD